MPKGIQMSSKMLAYAAAGFLVAGAAIAQTAQIELKDAWARATPSGAENGAAYLTIQSPTADRLVGVASPVAKKAELHTMTTEGGVMKMRPLEGVDVAPGQPVTLKPGGTHIMLLGLNQPLQQGKHFPVMLTFDKSGTKEVTVVVEKPGAMAPTAQNGGGHEMNGMPAHR